MIPGSRWTKPPAFMPLFFLLFLAAFRAMASTDYASPEDGVWILQTLHDQTAPLDYRDRPMHLEFDAEKGLVRGYAGVNRFHGTYRFNGKQLIIRKFAITRMVGPLIKEERRFLDVLQSGPDLEVRGLTLRLVDNRILAEFRKAPRLEVQPVDP